MPLTITIANVSPTAPVNSVATGFVDITNFCSNVSITTGKHGAESLSCDLNLTDSEVDVLFARNGHPQVTAMVDGVKVFCGRVEDVVRKDTGSGITAFGYARKFSDRTFTMLYIDSQYGEWKQTLPADISNRTNYEYLMDNQNQLYIGLKAQQTYGNNIDIGSFYYRTPSYLTGSGLIRRITLNFEYNLPAGWAININTFSESFGGGATIYGAIVTSGSVQTGSIAINASSSNYLLELGIYNNSGSNYVMMFDDGVYYIRFTAVVVMGVTTASVSATEIMKDLVPFVGVPISPRLSLIDDTNFILYNERYEDKTPAEIMDRLVGLGDASGNLFEWGVDNDGQAYLRKRGSASREWLAKGGTWSVERSTDGYYSTVYGVYKDPSGRTIRTPEVTNMDALDYAGVTRRTAVQLNVSNAGIAAAQRDLVLADRSTYPVRAQIVVNRIFTPEGIEWPLGHVKAGDYITVLTGRVTSSENETVRRFRVAHTSYQPESESLSLEPEEPFGSLEFILGRIAIQPTVGYQIGGKPGFGAQTPG